MKETRKKAILIFLLAIALFFTNVEAKENNLGNDIIPTSSST